MPSIVSSSEWKPRPRTGLTPEQLEIVRGDNLARDDVGTAFGRHDAADHGMRGESDEGLGLLLDIEKVRIGRRQMREFFAGARVDLDEAIRVLDGKILEKDRVHDAEDGRIQTDPEGERKRRHEGKARLTHESPERVSNIACEILHFFSVFRVGLPAERLPWAYLDASTPPQGFTNLRSGWFPET